MGTGRINRGFYIHLAVWVVMLAMPFFSLQPGRPLHGGVDYVLFLPVIASFIAVFYVNYLVLVKKYLLAHRTGLFIVWNVVLIAAAILFVRVTFLLFIAPSPIPYRPPRPFVDTVKFILYNAMVYACISGIAVALRMTEEWYSNESQRKEIEKAGAEAELATLKNQVNPHFLFNTLNNIYSLIQIDPVKAQEAVHDLSGMLRYVLYDSQPRTVPLSRECGFIRDYIKLMSARLTDDVSLSVSLPQTPSDTQIAPLLFIPLVENAFKHGISDSEPSFIRISLKETGDTLVFQVENSCFPKDGSDKSGSGIGLSNLVRRLDMLYPGRYSFEHGRVHSTYRSLLRIRTQNDI